jgi:hypothetical protein
LLAKADAPIFEMVCLSQQGFAISEKICRSLARARVGPVRNVASFR